MGDLGILLGQLGALLGAEQAVLELYWRPLGPSWAVDTPTGENFKTHQARKETIPDGGPLRAILRHPWDPGVLGGGTRGSHDV